MFSTTNGSAPHPAEPDDEQDLATAPDDARDEALSVATDALELVDPNSPYALPLQDGLPRVRKEEHIKGMFKSYEILRKAREGQSAKNKALSPSSASILSDTPASLAVDKQQQQELQVQKNQNSVPTN